MRKLSDEQWQSLSSALAREVARIAPDWTGHNTPDPGITVLELLAYALTDLQYRTNLDARGRALARRVAQLAESVAIATDTDACPPGLQRPKYSPGLLLSDEDLTAATNYARDRACRHNRLLHGVGVVSGLGVTLEATGGGAQVVIAPGLALDCLGQEIAVTATTSLPLPAQATSLLVLLHYDEQPCRPVPSPATDEDAPPLHSRVTETFRATLASTGDETAVALARANFSQGQWMLDQTFNAVKVT